MATAAPAAEPPSRQAQHETISKVASQHRVEQSSFRNGVSIHRMPQSVTFGSLRAVMASASGNEQRCFIGTVDGKITLSINFNYRPPPVPPTPAIGKKRGRDTTEEAIDAAAERVKRGLTAADEVTDAMITEAKQALLSLLTRLRGAQQEKAVESWALSYKKPDGNGSSSSSAGAGSMRPRLILSARLTPGVAVPLPSLFQALGTRCSEDGMLTTQDSSSLANGFNLPLSEHAQAAESHGQRALTLFATVCR
jgi:hypothetical protein